VLKYVEMIDDDKSPIIECTDLTEEDVRSEAIFLGLRLMRGIDLQNFQSAFESDLGDQYNGDLDRLVDAGLIEIADNRLRLTTRGALLSNEVFAVLA